MEYFKKIETLVIWAVILILGVAYGFLSNQADAPTTNAPAQQPAAVSQQDQPQQVAPAAQVKYQGEEGRTALNLLKANYRVETQSFGDMGEFVKSIDGVEPDSSHFWAYYVNGQIAQIGADAYVTKPADQVEWKLEKIQ